jgi:hypothetical protein
MSRAQQRRAAAVAYARHLEATILLAPPAKVAPPDRHPFAHSALALAEAHRERDDAFATKVLVRGREDRGTLGGDAMRRAVAGGDETPAIIRVAAALRKEARAKLDLADSLSEWYATAKAHVGALRNLKVEVMREDLAHNATVRVCKEPSCTGRALSSGADVEPHLANAHMELHLAKMLSKMGL